MGSDLVIESTKGFDPGFKLFGKTIPMGCCAPNGKEIKQSEKLSAKQEEEDPVLEQSSSLESNKENGSEANPEGEEEVRSAMEAENNNEGKNGEKPALKKPDKLLPCPRCESMDTKFCYYNNYNVNQPRHFCKNCQRYWTAGGTLRNVPVGAGRRKNKHSVAAASTASTTHYRQIRSASDVAALGDSDGVMIPCSLPAPCVKVGAIGGSRVQVLPFEVLDSGAPKVGGSSASGTTTVLNFGPQGRANCEQMEWQKQTRDEISCGSSVTSEREIQCNMKTVPVDCHNPKWPNGSVPGAAVPFFPGPWPFGWNFAAPTTWGALPWPMATGSHLGTWPPAPWITAPWAVPAATACNNSLDSGSPTLGKRSQSEPESKQTNGCLWVPKTLRIDDPGEAAKSSFWTTLGLGDKPDSITSGRVMFKAFQPKTEGTKDSSLRPEPAAEALHANPAAFSRSLSFQESN